MTILAALQLWVKLKHIMYLNTFCQTVFFVLPSVKLKHIMYLNLIDGSFFILSSR